MAKRRRTFKRLMLGDVLEIPLSKGQFAYAQFVYDYRRPPVWGPLIRVLSGIFQSRPEEFASIVEGKERFYCFFPAGSAVSQGLVQIVSNEEIPEQSRHFPLFKGCNRNSQTGEKTWYLWDGNREWKVGKLLPEHYDLPISQIVSFPVLVDRVKRGWSPRDEV